MSRTGLPLKTASHYAGDGSLWFWDRVNALTGPSHDQCYALGVALQDLEHRVLQWLENSEEMGRPPNDVPPPDHEDFMASRYAGLKSIRRAIDKRRKSIATAPLGPKFGPKGTR